MSDDQQRTFGDVTVKIDRLLCVGFGDCIELAPEVFVFDDEGIAVFTAESGNGVDRQRLLDACDACPVDALTVLGEGGEQLVP